LRVSLRCHGRGTTCPVDEENIEILMENIDAGAYLTERLRTNQPEPYAQEIARTARRALRGGFLLGVFSSFIVVIGLVGVLVVNDGGLVETVFGAR
jgi:RIO-like serine/threonine protein kinase